MDRGDEFTDSNTGSGAMWAAVLDEELRESVGQRYEALRDAEEAMAFRNGLGRARCLSDRSEIRTDAASESAAFDSGTD